MCVCVCVCVIAFNIFFLVCVIGRCDDNNNNNNNNINNDPSDVCNMYDV